MIAKNNSFRDFLYYHLLHVPAISTYGDFLFKLSKMSCIVNLHPTHSMFEEKCHIELTKIQCSYMYLSQ